jgi:WhiB family redox-sensing transcriptional regulator
VTILGQLFGIQHEDWQAEAVCATADPEAWWPEKGTSTFPARLICTQCPVRRDCLDFALTHNEDEGVWGGYSSRQRRRLKRGEIVELAVRAEPREPLVCVGCGEEFEASHGTAKYCSKYCSRNAHTERIQAKRKQARQAAA